MKRKYLVIAMDMSDLAAGIVFKRIVNAMADIAECEIICPKIDVEIKQQHKIIPCPSFKRYHPVVEQWVYNHFGIRLSEYFFGRTLYKIVASTTKHDSYDAVISFLYGSNLAPLFFRKSISSKLKLPWAVYTVDAIPAPLAWEPNEKHRKKLLRIIRKYLTEADAVFAANMKMLNYELDCLTYFKGLSGVVLTPCDNVEKTDVDNKSSPVVTFLYAGQIYNIRRIGSLLKGFEMFIEKKPNAKLIFVGSNKIEDFAGFEHLIANGSIERHGFTKNINAFYNKADILIDISGDVENDVFLSSKVCNYLTYNKPIIAISRDGSPVREMMSGCETIIHCHHDCVEILSALEKSVNVVSVDYRERDGLKKMFEAEEVAKGFCYDLEKMINKYNEGKNER